MVPKFRAWLIYLDMMVDVHSISFYDQTIFAIIDDYQNLEQKLEEYSLNDEAILLQSTGLEDRNKQEIFEGDIIKLKWTKFSEYEYFKVVIKKGHAPSIENDNRRGDLLNRNVYCEVVGNVCENSEMLGEIEI